MLCLLLKRRVVRPLAVARSGRCGARFLGAYRAGFSTPSLGRVGLAVVALSEMDRPEGLEVVQQEHSSTSGLAAWYLAQTLQVVREEAHLFWP